FSASATAAEVAGAVWPLADFGPSYLEALALACDRVGGSRAAEFVAKARAAFAETDPRRRLALLQKTFLGKKGDPYKPDWLFGKAPCAAMPDLAERYLAAASAIDETCDRVALYRMLEGTRAALTVADWLIARYEQAKRSRGFLDF